MCSGTQAPTHIHIYKINQIRFFKKPEFFFAKNFQADPKIYAEMEGTWISQNHLEKRTKLENAHFSNLITKLPKVRTTWHWCKDEDLGQRKQTQGPEWKPDVYGQLIFSEGAETKNSLSNKSHWDNGIATYINWIPSTQDAQEWTPNGSWKHRY